MNTESKYEMIKKLLSNTLARKLQWEKTSQQNAFQISIKDYVVTVLEQGDFNDPECILRIENSDGDLVEDIYWSELKDITDLETNKPGQVVLYQLYDAARHNAMGADRAIMEITTALDALPAQTNLPASKPNNPPPATGGSKSDDDDMPF
jgi:hypothetical protein